MPGLCLASTSQRARGKRRGWPGQVFSPAMTAQNGRHFFVDIRHHLNYIGIYPALSKDAFRRQAERWSGCGARGRICSLLSGGLGISLPALRPGREVLPWTGTGEGG
jgi:hypothetical protein